MWSANRSEPPRLNSHHDPKMHAHYSTISEAEKADALAKVVRLFPAPPETRATPLPGQGAGDPAPENATTV